MRGIYHVPFLTHHSPTHHFIFCMKPGKYVPALTHKIHMENQATPKIKVNLKGMAIGDGFTDPINMLNYGEYLHSIGLLDLKQKEHFEAEEEKARVSIQNGKFEETFLVCLLYCSPLLYFIFTCTMQCMKNVHWL